MLDHLLLSQERVRWTPLDLGSALIAWWDAEALSSISFGTGSAVASWTDVKNSIVVSQATGGSRPTYGASAFGRQQRPGLTFDALDDYLIRTPAPAEIPTGAGVYEVWSAYNQSALVADATVRTLFGIGNGTTVQARAASRLLGTAGGSDPTLSRWRVQAGDGSTSFTTTPATSPDLSGPGVVRAVYTGTAIRGSVNGRNTNDVAVVPNTPNTRFVIGGSAGTTPTAPLQGSINSLLITGLLSGLQAILLNNYLKGRL